MTPSPALQYLLLRDGTSQADRLQVALEPAYAPMDARSTKDLLIFAQQYAEELRYFNAQNQAMGDWSAFLSPDLDLDALVAFMETPEPASPANQPAFSRPHLVLFLAFLQLLRHAQTHLNTLTRRHLDFYYQQVLQLRKRPSVPDGVHVLFDLAPDTEPIRLPVGTELYAGTDSEGQDLVYGTDRELVVYPAQIEALSSVYVDTYLPAHSPCGEPLPRWRNLYPASDATAIQVQDGIEGDQTYPRWRTFGEAPPLVPADSPPPTSIGWAVTSPMLVLSQGKRTITLTLGFAEEGFDAEVIGLLLQAPDVDETPFRICISTATAWIEPASFTSQLGDYDTLLGQETREHPLQALQFTLIVDEDADALAAMPTEQAQIGSMWPILELRLRQIWRPHDLEAGLGRYITHEQPFRDLRLVNVHLQVAVEGLLPLQMQNDDVELQATKPFEPFGSEPVVGSRFYLGHPELAEKKLQSLDFHLTWIGGPTDLVSYYANYPAIVDGTEFATRISLIDRGRELSLSDAAPLFEDSNTTAEHAICITAFSDPLPEGFSYDRVTDIVTDDDLLSWSRYLQWELLAPDFQHSAYATVLTKKSNELAVDIASGAVQDADAYQVNPPYTPTLQRLSINYTAALEIDLATPEPEVSEDRVFHLHPFGYSAILPQREQDETIYLFLPSYPNEGELYIGLRDVQTPQQLSLLFQMAEGSTDPNIMPEPVQWSYLSGNRWMPLTGQDLPFDSTHGLIHVGVITLTLQPAEPNTLLAPDLYWLRASIESNSRSVCDTIALFPQAVSATFVDRDNTPDHLNQPLPAGSITALIEPEPAISAVHQPYASFGGRGAEQDLPFDTRVSERLRHKNRALTLWDYERLILAHFPQIYKAKCVPLTPEANPDALGQVEIIVIPDLRHQMAVDPFEPKVSVDVLANIDAYLADKTPAFASVRVKNPHYVQVKVKFAVRFRPGYDPGYYRQLLNDELNRFLSPWAYAGEADIVLGGRIYANVIVNFIDERPYVNYVAALELSSSEGGGPFELVLPAGEEGYWVETTRPDGILVAAQEHFIEIIPEGTDEDDDFTGINYMIVEFDFRVG